jgi:hypothetical protein
MLISPVFVVVLLTRINGIPLLEHRARKRWGNDPDFRRYTERNSARTRGLGYGHIGKRAQVTAVQIDAEFEGVSGLDFLVDADFEMRQRFELTRGGGNPFVAWELP